MGETGELNYPGSSQTLPIIINLCTELFYMIATVGIDCRFFQLVKHYLDCIFTENQANLSL
jgi:hypothetical protein